MRSSSNQNPLYFMCIYQQNVILLIWLLYSFTVCFTFCKRVHVGVRMRRGELVVFTHAERCKLTEIERRGVTVWGWKDGTAVTRHRCFFFSPSHVLYIHVHRGRILFKRVVLCFSPMLWMDGWRTEPNVSTWVAEETSWQTGKREQAGNNGLFHSFQGCIQCYSLRGPNIKTWYCMSLFSALSQVGFCFATRWSSFSTLLRGFVY